MADYTVDEFNRTKSKMASDFNKAITNAEELRKAAAEVSGDGSAAVPVNSDEKSGGARASLADASQAAVGTAGVLSQVQVVT